MSEGEDRRVCKRSLVDPDKKLAGWHSKASLKSLSSKLYTLAMGNRFMTTTICSIGLKLDDGDTHIRKLIDTITQRIPVARE